ncbi:MAG TPA: zf-HC2 domain-containing protein [Pyrinomonadaceae bacterium]|nr:zf-HC2 domain-containing protein [Pyrinomonadaceae bacterium]
MNCDGCQENLSQFLDGELDETQAANVRTHLSLCADCARLCEDFASILDNCKLEEISDDIPALNTNALWCRISNTLEAEIKPEPPIEAPPEPKGFFARVWNLSFSQAAAGVLAVALISSLLTVVGIRNYFQPTGEDFTSRSGESQTTFEKLLSKVGLTDTPQAARQKRLQEQQATIDYWNQRVQARRAMWDDNLRRGFDRNLQAIDQAVFEYKQTLEKDPDDELSGEMLDSVMTEKMNLLREFSEL